MLETLLAILLSFPAPFYPPGRNPETPEEYRARLETMARTIDEESRSELWNGRERVDLAAMITVTWYAESHLFLSVHNGRRRGAGGRANCLGQIIPNTLVPRSQWRRLHGSDLESTRRCAGATVRVLAYQADRCAPGRGPMTTAEAARVFAGYAKGHSCRPGGRSKSRASRWDAIREKLLSSHPITQ